MQNNYKYKRKIAVDQVSQKHTFCRTQLRVALILKNKMNPVIFFFFLSFP